MSHTGEWLAAVPAVRLMGLFHAAGQEEAAAGASAVAAGTERRDGRRFPAST